MSNKIFHIILAFTIVITSISFSAEGSKQRGKLIVKFEGIKEAKGNVKIALCNSSDNYYDHPNPFIGKVLSANDRYVIAEFDNLPFGEYAVKAFHDADSDNDLTTNFLGIPVEDYGFSNNVRGLFGPPSWEKAKFNFSNEKQEIEIQIK
jgi:uncharacterized protein (DUF2141 family)